MCICNVTRAAFVLFSIVLLQGGEVAAHPTQSVSPAGDSPVAGVKRGLESLPEAPVVTKRFICFYEGVWCLAEEQHDPERGTTLRTLMQLPPTLQDKLRERVRAPEKEAAQLEKEREKYPESMEEQWNELLERDFDSSWWSLVPPGILERLGWGRDSEYWV